MAQISYIKYADVLEARRYDAEYFKPEYLEIFDKTSNIKFEFLNSIAKVSDGDHAKFPDNQKSEVRYLRAKDIKGNFLLNDDPVFVSKDYFLKQKRSHIKGLNILMSIMGSIGDITITPENFETCLANRAICIIRDIEINPYYLFAYMTSGVADKNIQRIKKGGIQERINLELLSEIKIPILPQSFQLQIEKMVKSAHQKQTQSKQLYYEAEQLLLTELGLLNYHVKHEITFSTTKKEIEKAHRYDGEYFQPKYAEIIKKIEGYADGWDLVKNVVNLKDRNFNPKDDQQYKYLALSNISSQGYIQDYQEEFGKDLPSRARRKINKNDLIISSIEGSFSSCALIEEEFDNAICSTGFFVLNSEKINPETLLILFKSLVIQELLQRGSKGTILTAISKTELESIKIPLVKLSIQKQIAKKIQESHRLRKDSKDLLKEAKRKVESEIEK